ncbi:hypothetical protein EDD16DRAFT_1258035 [Pisolithus croceorrhizus]|nr:hypothetical protein EDD16DRAFT_1258035 [Pisolithus croceorrhizus]KAI6123121.1 hypothetical protein EV401DRAFT_1305942 [Pisolithus croceorrhizus]
MLPTLTQKLGIQLTLCASPSTIAFRPLPLHERRWFRECSSCPANRNGGTPRLARLSQVEDNTSGGTVHEARSDLRSSKFRGHSRMVQAVLERYQSGGLVHGVNVRNIDADTVVEEADSNDDEEPNGAAMYNRWRGPKLCLFPRPVDIKRKKGVTPKRS